MKVLYYKYFDNSAFHPVRGYLPEDYEQAEKDLQLLQQFASSDREWELIEIELYNQ